MCPPPDPISPLKQPYSAPRGLPQRPVSAPHVLLTKWSLYSLLTHQLGFILLWALALDIVDPQPRTRCLALAWGGGCNDILTLWQAHFGPRQLGCEQHRHALSRGRQPLGLSSATMSLVTLNTPQNDPRLVPCGVFGRLVREVSLYVPCLYVYFRPSIGVLRRRRDYAGIPSPHKVVFRVMEAGSRDFVYNLCPQRARNSDFLGDFHR